MRLGKMYTRAYSLRQTLTLREFTLCLLSIVAIPIGFSPVIVDACSVCQGGPVVVDEQIEIDASDVSGPAGVLAPFVSFDGSTIIIDVRDRPFHITFNGRVALMGGKKLHPSQFDQGGGHGTLHLHII